jgi:SAM-dependent methyltransferase
VSAEWFAGWFDSPYYHLLYNHRDDAEAERFIQNICRFLELPKGARAWDVACGKGRHSVALSKRGFSVTGTDLSKNSIEEASKSANDKLEFVVHDMRKPFRENYFDAVFNLFTSIGYFEESSDNFHVFKNVSTALVPGGRFVVDFFNSGKVAPTTGIEKTEIRGDLAFRIRKEIRDKRVVKSIRFQAEGKPYEFEERVCLLEKDDFLSYAAGAHLKCVKLFGSYDLEPFDANHSDRLILVFEKPRM